MPGIFRFRQLRKSRAGIRDTCCPGRRASRHRRAAPFSTRKHRRPLHRRSPLLHVLERGGTGSSRPQTFLREHVTVADATGLHLDAYVSCTRLNNHALDDLEICAGLGDLRGLHLRHLHWYNRRSARCHGSSYECSAILENVLTVSGGATDHCSPGLYPTSQEKSARSNWSGRLVFYDEAGITIILLLS